MGSWNAFAAATASMAKLEAMGLSLSVEIDAAAIQQSIAESGKTYLSPWLDPARNDFTAANFFWLVANSDEGAQIVGGGRLDQYQGNAAGCLHQMFERGFGPQTVSWVSPEIDAALDGRVMYLGDLHSRATGGLGRRAVRNYLCVANYLAAVQFRADVTYSFIRKADTLRGSADVNGFTNRIPGALVFQEVPDYMDAEGVLCYRPKGQDDGYFKEIRRELGHIERQRAGVHAYPAQAALAAMQAGGHGSAG
ncbi:MAG: hypothetical protein MK098_15410 [Marinovum sp.]|nr:hypothetical protein [Marinovum sp.]